MTGLTACTRYFSESFFNRIDGALDEIDRHLAKDDAGPVIDATASELTEVASASIRRIDPLATRFDPVEHLLQRCIREGLLAVTAGGVFFEHRADFCNRIG